MVACPNPVSGQNVKPNDEGTAVLGNSHAESVNAWVNDNLVNMRKKVKERATLSEVLETFAPPQAYAFHPGWVDGYFIYYGPISVKGTWSPLLLGPIEITYSQYNTVLGKRFSANPGPPNNMQSLEKARRDVSRWVELFERVQAGDTREQVEQLLGTAQAFDQLLEKPYSTGPSVPHIEVFYGSRGIDILPKPLRLGPVHLLYVPESKVMGGVGYRRLQSGLSVQSWSMEEINSSPVPMVVGWADRFELIAKLKTRHEVEKILGRPTASFGPSRGIWYGPSARREPWSSILGTKISVKYGTDGGLLYPEYHKDQLGYEVPFTSRSK